MRGQIYYAENQGELAQRTDAYVAKISTPVLMGMPGELSVATRTDGKTPDLVDKSELANGAGVELEEGPQQNLEMFN